MIKSQDKVPWIAPALVVAILAPGWTARAEPPPKEPPRLEVAGLEIGAVDLERSAEFYCGVLGFKPVAGGRTPDAVRLANGEVELTLRKVGLPATFDPEKVPHFYLNVEVNDLATTVGELEKRQLALLGPRRETAIGYFASLRDPAGNVHQVVERKPHSLQPFPPRMFNIGIRMASMAAAKDFYCRGLGFEVMGADHRPPIIPLKPRGAAPLILFEGSTTSAETGADVARAVLVLDVADLAWALDFLRQQGLTVTGRGEGFAMLADPSGNPVKLRQVRRAAAAGSIP
jgi:catechol 2,3-dioxygenase-like lactoylglutathione lyase family enzyme